MDEGGYEMTQTEKMPQTDLNYTKSKNHELGSNTSKDLIDNCDIDRVSDEMIWIEKMLSTDPNYIENKSQSDIYDKSNYNISDRMGSEKLRLDNQKILNSGII